MKVLYVEDESLNAGLIRQSFDQPGVDLQLDRVTNLGSAIETIGRSSSYDVVLLNLGLFSELGSELVQHIRRNQLPVGIVVSTRLNDPEAVRTALRAGVDEVVVMGEGGCFKGLMPILDRACCRAHGRVQRPDLPNSKSNHLAQEALLESQERYQALFSAITDAVLVHHLDEEDQPGLIVEANEVACELFGYTKDELLHLSIQDLDAPQSTVDRQHIVRELESGHSVLFEQVQLAKDGHRIPVEIHAHTIRLKGHSAILSTVRDISERKRSEEILRARNLQLMASEQQLRAANIMLLENEKQLLKNQAALQDNEKRLQTIMEHLPIGILVSERETGSIGYVNPSATEMIGLPQEQILWRPRQDFFIRSEELENTPIETEIGSGVKGVEQSLVTAEGKSIPVLHTAAWIHLFGREQVIEVFVDLSERKQAEAERKHLETQLRQSQKMEAIGQLAGGVAHDFNNLLQVIQGNIEIILAEAGQEQTVQNSLREVKQASDKAASLVRQLLAFSRRLPLKREVLNVNLVITELAKMLRRLIGEHIDLEIVTCSDLPSIFADRSQLEQVLMNLCVNSRDAMPQGGAITIETTWASCATRSCSCPANGSSRQFVRIRVTDTGLGIPVDLQDRIFEPFFTTKDVGKGTGLGLSTIYSIVKHHEGFVHFQSQPGQGTSFFICLPATHRESSDAGGNQSSAPSIAGQGEIILLAEDEELVRNLTIRILERAGYRVTVAKNGQEAMDLFHANPNLFDLAILDVVMPKRSGTQVYNSLQELRPDLPVLFSSGYSFDELDSLPLPPSHVPMIQKPFEPEDLLLQVQTLLTGSKKTQRKE